MLKSYAFTNPTKIVFGNSEINRLPQLMRELGGTRPLIVTDPGIAATGLLEKICLILENAGLPALTYDRVHADPDTQNIEEIHETAEAGKCDLIIGVGGGSSLDAAKGVSLLGTNQGRLQDFGGLNKVKKKGLPLIAIPTTAGTGSEVTSFIVLSDLEAGIKFTISSDLIVPDIALLDPEITLTLPPKMTAATGFDALTHAIEGYTSLSGEPISDALNLEAVRLIARALPIAVNSGSNIEARCDMLQGALLAGMGFHNSFLGLCHAMASPLGATFHAPHGIVNAVMLPYVMEYNYIACPEKFAVLAAALGTEARGADIYEKAHCAVDAVKKLLDLCHMPQSIREIKGRKENLDAVARDAMLSIQLRHNPRTAKQEDVRNLLEAAY